MPWVSEEMCVGCGVCVEECPVEAISMVDETARIDEQECIRCGRCHDVCPEEAVRHDSERIPKDVDANLAWTRRLLEHFDGSEEKRGLIERMQRYFAKEKKVAEQTIERLESMGKEL
ncbi:MAG: 4Fe-4S binding protein [Candidatus Brocadiae bacterium]|nr:4Fe-4S binding protein [Candidatus Brocadiia bacterium]